MSVKPSWQVTKLIAVERRPLRLGRRGEQVVRAGDAGGQLAGDAGVALDQLAHRVAELAVPLGPAAVGERPEPVLADAPGLGDQLDPREDRVGLDLVDDRRLPLLLLVDVDGEDRRQVEAEAVDVHLGHPVAQAVEDELADDRVVAVQRVAAAGEVVVELGLGREHVIDVVVQPLEADRRAVVVPLAGVVEDDVEDDLDVGACAARGRAS